MASISTCADKDYQSQLIADTAVLSSRHHHKRITLEKIMGQIQEILVSTDLFEYLVQVIYDDLPHSSFFLYFVFSLGYKQEL